METQEESVYLGQYSRTFKLIDELITLEEPAKPWDTSKIHLEATEECPWKYPLSMVGLVSCDSTQDFKKS